MSEPQPQPQTSIMPNLIGMSTQQASSALNDAGITLSIQNYDGSAVPASNDTFVADQTPCASSEATAATVYAVSSQGTNYFPEIIGETYTEAAELLTAAPYSLIVVPQGRIEDLVKSAKGSKSGCGISKGSKVNVGAHVTLVTQRPGGGLDGCA